MVKQNQRGLDGAEYIQPQQEMLDLADEDEYGEQESSENGQESDDQTALDPGLWDDAAVSPGEYLHQ